jgi:hypothetical protein
MKGGRIMKMVAWVKLKIICFCLWMMLRIESHGKQKLAMKFQFSRQMGIVLPLLE